MSDDNNYNNVQSPSGNYDQNPPTLYADNTSSPKSPKPAPAASAASPSPIHITVNSKSKITAAKLVDLINKTPGLLPELKGKIKFDKKTNSIIFPDFSNNKIVPGKEWLFDLGKAGNNWEITTATLILSLDGPTFFLFKEHVQKEEERGFQTSKDPDESLMSPSHDLVNVNRGLILGLTIPNESMLNKNPPPEGAEPRQIARLKNGKGLILIAWDLIVQKKGKQTTETIAIPDPMKVMATLHEISAHAGFLELGQPAEHSDPREPASNPVDRNAQQVEDIYKTQISKIQTAFEKKVKALVDGMNKAVP